jgi:uncharacterized protein YkwD
MLFVTPTSKRDVVENTNALLISAHKLPNVGWNAEIYKVSDTKRQPSSSALIL